MVDIATSTIVQQAFRFMGIGTLASLSDSDPKAVAANQMYEPAYTTILEKLDWSFASQLADLPEIADTAIATADSRLAHAYQLPGDLLVLREVVRKPKPAFRIDAGRVLRASVSGPLKIRYTRLIENELLTTATFRTTVALQLANFMAPQYVEVARKRQELKDDLTSAFSAAARTDAVSASPQGWRENTDDPSSDQGSSWIDEALS